MARKLKSVFYDKANNKKITIYKRLDDGLLSIQIYNLSNKSNIVLRRNKEHSEYISYLNILYKGLNMKKLKKKRN